MGVDWRRAASTGGVPIRHTRHFVVEVAYFGPGFSQARVPSCEELDHFSGYFGFIASDFEFTRDTFSPSDYLSRHLFDCHLYQF